MNLTLGATYLEGSRGQFVVWAPLAERVEVRVFDDRASSSVTGTVFGGSHNSGRLIGLRRTDHGYHEGIAEGIRPGTWYVYCLDGNKGRPDPASRFQPEGVHGASQVVDPRAFRWEDACWRGLSLEDYIIYEIHVGTYSSEGTFDAIIPYLGGIEELGVTALELMPVAQFPGDRNWGYDGVYPFAVQNSYGGPEGLRRLVEACHEHGLAVVLDVVYNHLGPEGNYLRDFGPYFTDQYRSSWGQAINFDGPESDEVVRYFTENALYWLRDFHIDALRLDAIHAIVDCNAQPFLRLLAQAVHEFARQSGRKIYLIAESDLNDVRYIRPAESGGCELDAQWSDDFHHAVHTLLTGEQSGYYLDFGRIEHLGKAFEESFVYSGQFSAYRRRRHGNSSRHIPARQFVVFAQNHDQVGNRLFGERLSTLVSFEALKLAAGMVILSPYIPLLFMGEEWGETAPFQYFTSHSDAALIEAVRRGRREEFAAFRWDGEPPEPQDEATFLRCKLDHSLKHTEPHRMLSEFYQELIKLRTTLRAFARLSKEHLEVRGFEKERTLQVRRWSDVEEALFVANFSDELRTVLLAAPVGVWDNKLDSADRRWGGARELCSANLQFRGRASFESVPKIVYGISKIGLTLKTWDTFAFTDIFTSRRAKTPGSKPSNFRIRRTPITTGMNGSMLSVTRRTQPLAFWTRKSASSAL
jgi:maltooligosyltrehalose trehalohydrolase